MRKLVISLCAAGSAASAAARSSRDVKSALRVAWEWPSAWRGSPTAAEEPKAFPEENAGRDRRVVQMLSGALLFVILGLPVVWDALSFSASFVSSFPYPGEVDDEDDEDHAVWRTGVYEHRPSELREVREWEPVSMRDLVLRTYFVPDGSDASDASDDELEL